MSPITTHILDTSGGSPAPGVKVELEFSAGDGWAQIGAGQTDDDGRIKDLLPIDHRLVPGDYRLLFHCESYFAERKVEAFYKTIPIVFSLAEPAEHYHVPLLLNPFGYSTYRGS